MMKYIKRLFLLLSIFTAMSLWANSFTDVQEARIRAIIRESLIIDPTILEQAITSFQAYREQQQGGQLNDIIKQNWAELYENPYSPRMGSRNPLVTLVVFTDYNCPYCKRFDPILTQLVKENPDIAIIIKFLPYQGESSVSSAAQALAVWQKAPEKFWQLNALLNKKIGMHDATTIEMAKTKAGVSHIYSDDSQIDLLKNNFTLADALKIRGTPFTLVGNQTLSGAVSYDEIDAAVQAQIKQWTGN